jgi:hypothetical protein
MTGEDARQGIAPKTAERACRVFPRDRSALSPRRQESRIHYVTSRAPHKVAFVIFPGNGWQVRGQAARGGEFHTNAAFQSIIIPLPGVLVFIATGHGLKTKNSWPSTGRAFGSLTFWN